MGEESEMLRAGFGRVDITPELGLPMVGMPGSPRGKGVQWPLHGRIFLADDGQRRVAVVCLDVIGLETEDVAGLRAQLAERGGLAPEQIMIACSHTHRAPFPTSSVGIAPDTILAVDDGKGQSFLADITARLLMAMDAAVAGLEPAALRVGRVQAPGWAFNRRPIYANGQVGTHGWAWLDGFAGMEGEPDEELWVLAARRPDGSVIGGLAGFSCHPTAMGHDPVYSADYAGVLVEALEARHGGVFGFLLGAAGDTSTPDPTSRDPESGFGIAHTRAMGTALAERAEEALAAARAVRDDRVDAAMGTVSIAQRLATPEQV
jgi:neutral ceramidase